MSEAKKVPINPEARARAMVKQLEAAPGYARAWYEDGRVCVEVDVNSNATFWDNRHLYQRAWGPEWPIVRSSRVDQVPPLEFTSHGS